jgi:hypothetical protein
MATDTICAVHGNHDDNGYRRNPNNIPLTLNLIDSLWYSKPAPPLPEGGLFSSTIRIIRNS